MYILLEEIIVDVTIVVQTQRYRNVKGGDQSGFEVAPRWKC